MARTVQMHGTRGEEVPAVQCRVLGSKEALGTRRSGAWNGAG